MTRRLESAAGLEIPGAILRRLDGIEAELPRTPRWRPEGRGDARLHVVRAQVVARTRPVGPARFAFERLIAAAVVIAVVGAGALVVGSSDSSGRLPTPTPPAFVPQFSPPATTAPKPTPIRAAPTPVRLGPERIETAGDLDAATLLARRLGWACRLHTDVADGEADLRSVDKIVEARDIREGWVATGTKQRVWLGSDVYAAAAAFGAVIVARDAGVHTWIAVKTANGVTAYELATQRTPGGRLTWHLSDSEQAVPCTTGLREKLGSAAGRTKLSGAGPQVIGFRVLDTGSVRDLAGHPS